ncbi:MAG: hypothetical protein Q8840_02270 [Sweet potato little leaf phytoplasma]|nr:hypothetical protein [Sweet potato little leaf phytoplasma]
MHGTDFKGVEFVAYQLKDVAYQWYEEWKQLRGDDSEPSLWDEFLSAFLGHFFPQELKEAKAEKFVKL